MSLRRGKKRRTGTWSREGLAKRTKEMWHIPKRSNIKQVTGAIELFLDPKIDLNERKWTKGRRETFNTELAKRGLTESGSPLSPSGLRTLIALIKYFGFIYFDNEIIKVTEAGSKLVDDPGGIFRLQILKLQISNPVIIRDCRNILVFPFRRTLDLLLETSLNGYLSFDEIGYILFMKMKNTSDYSTVKGEIVDFRKKGKRERQSIIDKFIQTPEGKVTLGEAPSASYFVSFCLATELCEANRSLRKLYVKPEKRKYVEKLLQNFRDATPYDFGTDLKLWIRYYGTPDRLKPPKDIPISFY